MTDPPEIRQGRPADNGEDDPAHDVLRLADEALEQLEHDDHAENGCGVRKHRGENAGGVRGHGGDGGTDDGRNFGESRTCADNQRQRESGGFADLHDFPFQGKEVELRVGGGMLPHEGRRMRRPSWRRHSAHFNESPEEFENVTHREADAPRAKQVAADFGNVHAVCPARKPSAHIAQRPTTKIRS